MEHNLLMVGQSVHYIAYNGTHLAAIIIGIQINGNADLAVFTSMPNVNGQKNFGLQFHQDVSYNPQPNPGTYHFFGDH